jgi:hypothetical protein
MGRGNAAALDYVIIACNNTRWPKAGLDDGTMVYVNGNMKTQPSGIKGKRP